MNVTVRGRTEHFRTVTFDARTNAVRLIEQRLLPHEFKIVATRTYRETARAITDMVVRGAGDRATEFKQRCSQLGIKGVTLHSYRYAWAERAKTAGMPERFAMENLGHNSKAVHRAYAKKALVKIPLLQDYEDRSQNAAYLD